MSEDTLRVQQLADDPAVSPDEEPEYQRLRAIRDAKIASHKCLEPGCSEHVYHYCGRHNGSWLDRRK